MRDEWLRDYPRPGGHIESFVYWSQESYGAGKPVVVVTHVGLVPPRLPGDPAIVTGTQIMATWYMTGGIYLNRTGVDLLGGFLGPIKRSVLESRLKRDAPTILERLRRRLERRAAAPVS